MSSRASPATYHFALKLHYCTCSVDIFGPLIIHLTKVLLTNITKSSSSRLSVVVQTPFQPLFSHQSSQFSRQNIVTYKFELVFEFVFLLAIMKHFLDCDSH